MRQIQSDNLATACMARPALPKSRTWCAASILNVAASVSKVKVTASLSPLFSLCVHARAMAVGTYQFRDKETRNAVSRKAQT